MSSKANTVHSDPIEPAMPDAQAVASTGIGNDQLVRRLLRHAPGQGLADTPVTGVRVFRSDGHVSRAPCIYEPCVVMVLQGTKRAYLGGESIDYTPSNYVVFSVAMPMETEIVGASPDRPFLAVSLATEPAVITDLQMRIDRSEPSPARPIRSVTVSEIDPQIRDALHRLIATFDNPTDARVLGPMVVNEIFYRVLLGHQGSILRAAVHRHDHYHRIYQLLKNIQSDCSVDFSTSEMARMANMSKASLHNSFKSITSFTPLQYLKSIRLHKARALMLNDGLSAAAAAHAVGYSSASQFSREFKRLFGHPPSLEVRQDNSLNFG